MRPKKILYIKAQWLGDMIWWIPFLVEQQKLWNEVYQTFYDMRYINRGLHKLDIHVQKRYKRTPMYWGWYNILETLKSQWLLKDIVLIPYSYRNIFCFLMRNFKKYDEAIIPIKTRAAKLLWWILAKKTCIIFDHINDTSKYRILADGEQGGACLPLYQYHHIIQWPLEKVFLSEKYVTLFPSLYERSIAMKEWIGIITWLRESNYRVIIVGWEREQRFIDDLQDYPIYTEVDNYLWRTTLPQMMYLFQYAILTISCNGWPMRIANLLNKNCINIHTVSAFIMQPPVDNIHSFNVRPYHYKECKPCEAATTPLDRNMPQCVFCNTTRVGECRNTLVAQNIVYIIKKYLRDS